MLVLVALLSSFMKQKKENNMLTNWKGSNPVREDVQINTSFISREPQKKQLQKKLGFQRNLETIVLVKMTMFLTCERLENSALSTPRPGKKYNITTTGRVNFFRISGKMQAKFYAVLIKLYVILQWCTLKGIFGNFLRILAIQWCFVIKWGGLFRFTRFFG